MSSSVLPPHLAKTVRAVVWRDAGALKIAGDDNSSGQQQEGATNAQAFIDVEAIRQEAYAEGFRAAEKAAGENATAQLQPLIDRLTRALSSLIELRPRIRRDGEAELVRLSLAVARKILHRELTVDPTAVQGVIKAALEKLQSRDCSRVRLHPDLEPVVEACMQRLAPTRKVEIVKDGSLQPWDILFETDSGWLDASLDTQIREIERGFVDRIAR